MKFCFSYPEFFIATLFFLAIQSIRICQSYVAKEQLSVSQQPCTWLSTISQKKLAEKKLAEKKIGRKKNWLEKNRPKHWPGTLALPRRVQKYLKKLKKKIGFFKYQLQSTYFNHPSIAQLVEHAGLVQRTGVRFPSKELFFNQ